MAPPVTTALPVRPVPKATKVILATPAPRDLKETKGIPVPTALPVRPVRPVRLVLRALMALMVQLVLLVLRGLLVLRVLQGLQVRLVLRALMVQLVLLVIREVTVLPVPMGSIVLVRRVAKDKEGRNLFNDAVKDALAKLLEVCTTAMVDVGKLNSVACRISGKGMRVMVTCDTNSGVQITYATTYPVPNSDTGDFWDTLAKSAASPASPIA